MKHYLQLLVAASSMTSSAFLVLACSSDDSGAKNKGGADAGSGGDTSGGGAGNPGGGDTAKGGAKPGAGGAGPKCKPASDTETACSDGKDDDCDGFVDCLDTDCEGKSCGSDLSCLAGACLGKGALPDLPRIDNIVPLIRGDTAIVDFSAVKDALDYRVYPLPADEDILVGANGEVAVKNAVYRCSGAMAREDRAEDDIKKFDQSLAGNVEGYTRKEDESLLGYVFITPGPGREAIYRVGNPNSIGAYTWEYDAPPAKEYNGAEYVQGTDARDALLAKGWRDDGIAFYVASDGTRSVYRTEYTSGGTVTFYVDGPEKDARDKATGTESGERFKILDTQADGSVPLYRIFYAYNNSHDNLAAGDANRERVLHQGNLPVTSVTWPGLKEETTLVIEALDQGCPWPGAYIGAQAAPADVLGGVQGNKIETLDDARLPSGEVFINGQFEPTNRPKPIARAYVKVAPKAQPQMDWFEDFESDAGLDTFSTIVEDNVGTRIFRNDRMSVEFLVTNNTWSYGPLLSEFAMGSSANFFIIPLNANATISADKFVHTTMMVDIGSTNRRYPLMWITDTPIAKPDEFESIKMPVAERLGPRPFEHLPPGPYHTIVAQMFSGSPEIQMQFCSLRGWGVSQQCGRANVYGYPAGDNNATFEQPWLPLPVAGDYVGMDRPVKFDLYASTEKAYFFLEDKPAGCMVLPSGEMPAGPVTAVFGAAAYHIEIDEFVVHPNSRHQYWQRYSIAHSERKFDDVGVKSGVDLPPWDEALMPCGTQFYGEDPP